MAPASDPRDGEPAVSMPTLAAALREGGYPLGEEAFEHGLTVLVAVTEVALRTGSPTP